MRNIKGNNNSCFSLFFKIKTKTMGIEYHNKCQFLLKNIASNQAGNVLTKLREYFPKPGKIINSGVIANFPNGKSISNPPE